MDPTQRMSALEVALTNEANEREFYLAHAARTKNPAGKAMFEQIAADELEHYNRLKALHEKWKANERWPETIPLTVKGTDVRNMLKGILLKAKDAPVGDADDLKAIEEACDFEAKGEKLYREMSEASADEREKKFFSLLAGIEREHYLSLKDTDEYLRDPSSWFAKKERHGLDGA